MTEIWRKSPDLRRLYLDSTQLNSAQPNSAQLNPAQLISAQIITTGVKRLKE